MIRYFTLSFLALFFSLCSMAKSPGRVPFGAPGGGLPTGVRHVNSSTQKEGLIGVTAASPTDNPADNLFHVYLSRSLTCNERVWLSYDLDGVQDKQQFISLSNRRRHSAKMSKMS